MSAWENYHLEWSPDPLTVTNPSWQDITSYALAPGGAAPISIPGTTSSTGASDSGNRMTVSLDNSDHRFTFGNTSSPLSPNWKPGRRIRCYETIAGKRFDLFSGFIQPPETSDWAEKGVDQYMMVSAVDRLGWLNTARAFVSTLAEHVIFNGGNALRAYYPLGESRAPFRPILGSTFDALTETVSLATTGDPTQNGYRVANATIGADDLPVVLFSPQFQAGTPAVAIAETYLTANYNSGAGFATTGANVTVACWVNPLVTAANAQWRPVQIGFGTGLAGGYIRIRRTDSTESPAASWKATFTDDLLGAWTATAYGTGTASVPTLLACRINLLANTMSLFVNGVQFAATVTGTMPSTINLLSAIIGDNYAGNLGHLQIYDSTSTYDHTFAAHQAQYAMGVTGLAGQTTGQRIATLAQYAGVPSTDLGLVDPGVATMQVATLAGRNPLTQMRNAETTEQGRLRTNGQGLLVFDPRTRRYNS